MQKYHPITKTQPLPTNPKPLTYQLNKLIHTALTLELLATEAIADQTALNIINRNITSIKKTLKTLQK